jgi:hypothetical protein
MKNILKKLDVALKDFSSGGNVQFPQQTLSNGAIIITPLKAEINPEERIREPWMVFIIFVILKGFKHYGPFEKVAWEIPVIYKGSNLILTHQKFGFYIYYGIGDANADQLSVEAYRKIRRIFSIAQSLMQPKINDLFMKGKFTIDNSSRSIFRRYQFFSKKVRRSIKQVAKYTNSIETFSELKERQKALMKIGRLNETILFFTSAMVDAFFSYIENVLVLLIPFIDLESKIDVRQYIQNNWSEKFKKLLDLSRDSELKKIYDDLQKIKEQFRNPISHGHFKKDESNFHVHFPRLGAIPMELIRDKNKLKYSFERFSRFKSDDIITVFQSLIKYLRTNEKTKFGYYYINDGLPVFYDRENRMKYKIKMKSFKTWKLYLNNLAHQLDIATNMDW